MELFLPTYRNITNIYSESRDTGKRFKKSFIKECSKYRKLIEENRGKDSKIDNINIGYLTIWDNPIQLGMNLLNPGGEIFIPSGTYILQDDEIDFVSDVIVRGSGYTTYIKQEKTAADHKQLFSVVAVNNVTIKDLRLYGDSGTIFGDGYGSEHDHAIMLKDGNNFRLYNLDITYFCGDGIYISGTPTGGSDITDVIISNCKIVIQNQQNTPVVGRNCISIAPEGGNDAKRIVISNCHLEGGNPSVIDLEPSQNGSGCEDITISGNTIKNYTGQGYRCVTVASNVTGTFNKRVNISNNNFYCVNNGYGVDIESLTTIYGNTDIVVSNNTFYGGTYGVWSRASTNLIIDGNNFRESDYGIFCIEGHRNITISNNGFRKCGKYSIAVTKNAYDNRCINITGNVILNSSQDYSGKYSDIYANSTNDCNITNNILSDDQASPTSKYPLEAINCDRLTFSNNLSRGHQTSDSPVLIECSDALRKFNWIGDNVVSVGDITLDFSTENYRVGGNTEDGEDGMRIHALANYGYIDLKGGEGILFRVDDTDGSTEIMRVTGTKLDIIKNLEVDGNTTLGNESVDLITCNAKLKVRDLGQDPTSAATGGKQGELAYYNDTLYIKITDDNVNTNWDEINVVGGPVTAHDLGGSDHNADTLENLNLKVSDATLVDEDDMVLCDGSNALTANWDVGSYKITAQQLESDVATGTAPLVIASTTMVSNLNADLLDGENASEFLKKNGSVALTSDWDAGAYKISASMFDSDIVTGTAPIAVASTTVCTNLNADMVDGNHASSFENAGSVAAHEGSYNHSNYNTAYGWGDHSSAGYAADSTVIKKDGSVDFTGDETWSNEKKIILNDDASNYMRLWSVDAGYGYIDLTTDNVAPEDRIIIRINGTERLGISSNRILAATAYLKCNGYIDAIGGFKDNGTAGIDTTFTDNDGNTITVSGGIITAKTAP